MRQWQGGRGPSAAGAPTPITVSVLMKVIQFRYYYYYAVMHCPDMITRINYLPHFSASRDVPKLVLRRLTDEEVAGAVNGKRLGGLLT